MGGRGSGTVKLTTEKVAAFCAALASSGGNVTRACEAVDISRVTAYEWRRTNELFAKRWDEAKAIGVEALEDEARRRAFEGVQEPVFYLGNTVGTIQRYSDTLAIFLLKGAMPEKYRERTEVKHDVTENLAAEMAQARARLKGEAA